MVALLYTIAFCYLMYTYPMDILMYLVSIYNYIISLFRENYVVYYDVKQNIFSNDNSELNKNDYIFYFQLLKQDRYVRIQNGEENERTIVPIIDTLPCFTFEVTIEDLNDTTCKTIDIYDSLIMYLIEGNTIDRNVVAFILLYHHQINVKHYLNIKINYVNDECDVVQMTWNECLEWKLEL